MLKCSVLFRSKQIRFFLGAKSSARRNGQKSFLKRKRPAFNRLTDKAGPLADSAQTKPNPLYSGQMDLHKCTASSKVLDVLYYIVKYLFCQ